VRLEIQKILEEKMAPETPGLIFLRLDQGPVTN